MGLLDMTPDQAQKLIDFGMGTMAAGARTGNFGEAVAQGYGLMQQGDRNRLRDSALQQQMAAQRQAEEMRDYEFQRQQAQHRAQQFAPSAIRSAVEMGVPVAEAWRNQNPQLPQGMRYNAETGQVEVMPGYIEMKQQMGKAAEPYYQFLSTPQGYVVGNARTGEIASPASPIMKASDDPVLQGRIAEARAGGKEYGETRAQANIGLQKNIDQAEETIKLVDDLLSHKGFGPAVGLSSKIDPRNYVPGTDATDFNIRLDQLKGKQFLQAFESLKGGGQITEVEGKKATEAISRMNTAASEDEFVRASREFQSIIRNGLARAKNSAGVITKPLLSERSMRESMGDIPQEGQKAYNVEEIRKEMARTKDPKASALLRDELNKQVVKRGAYGGRRVVQYADGSVDYAD